VVSADADDFQSLRDFWHALCSGERSRGIDLPHVCQEWAAVKRESLEKSPSQRDFDQLCDAGCRPFSLALALAVIEVFKGTGTTWQKAFGSVRHRQQVIRAISKGADALEEVQERFIDISLEKFKLKLDDDLRKSLSSDPSVISAKGRGGGEVF
jgi:hypothetical protein